MFPVVLRSREEALINLTEDSGRCTDKDFLLLSSYYVPIHRIRNKFTHIPTYVYLYIYIYFRFLSFLCTFSLSVKVGKQIMPRDNIPKSSVKKLQQFFTKTLGR
jgi:hypothetical protein